MSKRSNASHASLLREQVHIWEAIQAAQLRWPEVARLVYETETAESLANELVRLLGLDIVQAVAVSDMQLRRFGRLEREGVERRLIELRAELAVLDTTK